MKFKLDENLSERGCALLAHEGYDVSTVARQDMEAEPDSRIIEVCRQEDRILVTLDLNFANPLIYRPSDYSGIAVLRLSKKTSAQDMLEVVQTLVIGLRKQEITGMLWIVERSRIRVFQQNDPT